MGSTPFNPTLCGFRCGISNLIQPIIMLPSTYMIPGLIFFHTCFEGPIQVLRDWPRTFAIRSREGVSPAELALAGWPHINALANISLPFVQLPRLQ
jgi:hypothetical protein